MPPTPTESDAIVNAMPAEPATVDPPTHALHALTTYELRRYRADLEAAIAFFDLRTPVPPARADLQTALDAVLAEQAEREHIRRANGIV